MGQLASNKPYNPREWTFLFSVQVIQWVRTLPKDSGTQVVVKQLVRSASSVGANVEEVDGTNTVKDRVYKWTLSRKEARESRYWIRLLCAVGPNSNEGQTLERESTELIKILSTLINKNSPSEST